MKAYPICAVFFLSSCSFFITDEVKVEYTLNSASEDAIADVMCINKRQEKITELDVPAGWSYLFSPDEGSQLLYIRVSNVRNAPMRARIRVDSEIINDIVVREEGLKGISAWGNNEGIKIYYTMDTDHPGYALFNTPTGMDSLDVLDFGAEEGATRLGRIEFTADAGFESSISLVGEGALSEENCLFAQIEFEPFPGERLDLISDRLCDDNRTHVNVNAKIPGYSFVP